MTRRFLFVAAALALVVPSRAEAQGVFMMPQEQQSHVYQFQQTPGLNFNQSPPGWQGWQQSPTIPPGHGQQGYYGGWYWVPPTVPNPSQSLQGHNMAPDWSSNGGCPPGTRPGTIWGGGGWQGDGQCHTNPHLNVRPLPHPHAHPSIPHQNGPAQRRPWSP